MRLWRASIRTRLTLLYGGMVFLAASLLVGVGYLLVRQTLTVGLRDINGAMQLDVDTLPPEKREFWLGRLAEQRALQDQALDRLLLYFLAATAVVGVLSLLAGWVLSGRVVRPIHHITATARGVAERSLGERIRLTGPDDEMKELADTFDAMLERLDRAFDGQRRFVANASHELRTPLATSRTLIQVALGKPGACRDLRRLGTALLEINSQQQRQTEALLLLARSEQAAVDRQPVDLGEIARRAVASVAEEAATAGVQVHVYGRGHTIEGDPTLLEMLVRNLLLNGVRHNHPDGWVRVENGHAGGLAWLEVSNTTTNVLSERDVYLIFEPFHRVGAPRTKNDSGAGLGLSIVRSIATAHGGRVTARYRDGGELSVRVQFELPYREVAGATSAAVMPERRTTPPPSTSTAGKL
jgi:signal transduction histidine kinase